MTTRLFYLITFLGFSTHALCQLQSVDIGDAVIHYIDKGSGEPVVYIHGGFEDYRTFEPQLEAFSKNYRAITYSRRYNYPNANAKELRNYSAETEADDLAEMIKKLRLEPVHLIGHSFGGLTALVFATKYPASVRSLTLSEPAVLSWLPDVPGGQAEFDRFYNELATPCKLAFEQRDTAKVLTHTFNYFYGSDISAELTPEIRAVLMNNLPEWRAIFVSPNAFTQVEREEAKSLKVPVSILTGGQTISVLKLTNEELLRVFPDATHFHLPEGTHDFWFTHPQILGDAVLEFINDH